MNKKFIKNAITAEEVKEKYFELLKKYQDNANKMEIINKEFTDLMGGLRNIHRNHITNELYRFDYKDSVEHFKKIVNKYSKVEGVNVEVNGCFVYVTGEKTIDIKGDLKVDNFKYQPADNVKGRPARWYYSSRPYKTAKDYVEANKRAELAQATA